MKKSFESGHTRNVTNLEALLSVCINLGADYNPSKQNIRLSELQQLLADAKAIMQDVNNKMTTYNQVVNERKAVFAEIKPFATRLFNILAASDARPDTIDDAKGFVRKIQGGRAKPKKKAVLDPDNPDEIQPKTISVSQQSYDLITEHFAKLINLLELEAGYQPNESDLQVAALNDLLTGMRNANSALINAQTELDFSRNARNEKFYLLDKCLYNTVSDVKKYLKGKFGTNNFRYKEAVALKFICIK